jgi:3-methyladenine DNA glycosylase AlkD
LSIPVVASTAERVREVLAFLERRGSRKNREGMARYAITAPKVFGVSVGTLHQLAKRLGRDHELALALWETGWYEARMLAAFVDEPARVTSAQMNRWAKQFDNWAICDTHSLHLFDRTPHAWSKIQEWSGRREEFVKRAAFALLAGVALHDKHAPDHTFLAALPLTERASTDERNFVKKAVSWALRTIGQRSVPLHAAVLTVANRLAASADTTARWVGRDVVRDLTRPVIHARLARRAVKDAPRSRAITRARRARPARERDGHRP